MFKPPALGTSIEINEQLAKDLIEYGTNYVKLGRALLSKKTKITKLVELSTKVGLKIQLDFSHTQTSKPPEDTFDEDSNP
jgi:hypothetical protein